MANALCGIGIGLVLAAAWWLHPAAGLAATGGFALLIGVGLAAKEKHDR